MHEWSIRSLRHINSSVSIRLEFLLILCFILYIVISDSVNSNVSYIGTVPIIIIIITIGPLITLYKQTNHKQSRELREMNCVFKWLLLG